MLCRIQCTNQVVFQEICEKLTQRHILYLAEAPKLEIQAKEHADVITSLLQEYGSSAQVLVHQ